MLNTLKEINLMEFMAKCWHTEFVREKTGYVTRAPFREEKNPSLYVNQKDDGHWVFFDHGTGKGGTIIDAVMAYDGHEDVGLGIQSAKRMAAEVGLLEQELAESPSAGPKPELETLYQKFCGNDSRPAREYLIGRGIAAKLVDDLIARRVVLLNRLRGTDYCCFALRDRTGKLCGLFNRKIEGPGSRERFLLGVQQVFCTDWDQVAKAPKITICEAVIDALSVQTLDKDACVIAVPGTSFDLAHLTMLPHTACLVNAFDADDAGKLAGKRLERYFPRCKITRYKLLGAHDVNEMLCSRRKTDRSAKLSSQDRVEIALSDKPSRQLAKQYNVHHSRVCAIRKEASNILAETWEQRRPGRKAKQVPTPEVDVLQASRDGIEREKDLLKMRVEWLELQVKIEHQRGVEAAHLSKLRKKKTSKKPRK